MGNPPVRRLTSIPHSALIWLPHVGCYRDARFDLRLICDGRILLYSAASVESASSPAILRVNRSLRLAYSRLRA
jgi:hypothetical protein